MIWLANARMELQADLRGSELLVRDYLSSSLSSSLGLGEHRQEPPRAREVGLATALATKWQKDLADI